MSVAATTRRQALGGAVALGAAALAGAPRAHAQDDDDATALATVIALQQQALVTYEALESGDLLDAGAQALARAFAGHERDQLAALAEALEELGGGDPPEPPSPESVDGLGRLRSQGRALEFAIELETRAVAACYDAAGQLDDTGALLAVAGVMAADAQHLVLLRQAAGDPPLPEAFVTGAPVG